MVHEPEIMMVSYTGYSLEGSFVLFHSKHDVSPDDI